ncbi:MAG TPA: M36 family metallopeptidase, partial [Urbifossiella sp.]|nr:M36 family metallopeptidase [Urbifossiella sp.]
FATPRGDRLAWTTLVFADSQRVLHTVVDASSGSVLRRANLVRRADTGRALSYFPSAAAGNAYADRNFTPYIDNSGALSNTRLRGNFAWTYADENAADDNDDAPNPGAGQQIPPSSGSGTTAADWAYNPVDESAGAEPGRTCPTSGCTWNAPPTFLGSAFSALSNWQQNRNQVATQTHYFVSRFHDHLLSSPIAFDVASGNFEGNDRVHAQVNDGANTGPLPQFTNNASMFTLPDGQPPIMEMFLFTTGAAHDVNGGDDAQVVLHEYGHGLSNRLVCCAVGGFGQLTSDQSGAMGEAWSDWYMFDYAEASGFQGDSAAAGELVQGRYENVEFVSSASDCPLGVANANCPSQGYTYADFGQISGSGPEVHFDGEIWTQTLWDLRSRLIAAHGRSDGIIRARRLITGGMRRSPGEPDFLDMRDAILATDAQLQGSGDRTLIRQVFAARGMGGCAASDGGFDTTPTANFSATGCAFSDTPSLPSTPGTASPQRISDIGFGGFPGRRTSLRRVVRRGLAGRVSCNANCSFRASLVLPRSSSRKARFRSRNAVVSRVSSGDAAGGSGRRIRFRFRRSVGRKLRRLTRGTVLEVRVTATDSTGTRRTEKKKLRLRR